MVQLNFKYAKFNFKTKIELIFQIKIMYEHRYVTESIEKMYL